MPINKFEMMCLNCVADDYESVETISEDLSREFEMEFSKIQIFKFFEKLKTEGLIDSFVSDPNSHQLVPTNALHEKEIEDYWFYLNPTGRKIMNENWEEVMGKDA